MRKLLTVCLVCFGQLVLAQNTTPTWRLTEIEFEQRSAASPTDNQAKYVLHFELSYRGVVSQERVGIKYEDLLALAKFRRVDKPEGLVGTMWADDPGNLTMEDSILRLVFYLHHPDYKPPTYESLIEQAQEALAKLQCPDFSNQDFTIVDDAFREAYRKGFPYATNTPPNFQTSSVWLDSFVQGIRQRSQGRVEVEVSRPRLYSDPIRIVVAQQGKQLEVGMDPTPDGRSFSCSSR